METKQIKIPIYKLHRHSLKDYATTGKHMFLYATGKIYNEYKNTDIIYNFGKEIYKVEYISNIECGDDLIDFLNPKVIYYTYDYEKERKYDFIYLMEFQVEEMKE